MIDELLENPGFLILAGSSVGAITLGYIFAKKMGLEAMSWWQLIVLIVGAIAASAYFATKD